MGSLIAASARALATGDVLGSLDRVALREDPPALAPRGIAMALRGELPRARDLLRRAARGFGAHEALSRAGRVVVAVGPLLFGAVHCLRHRTVARAAPRAMHALLAPGSLVGGTAHGAGRMLVPMLASCAADRADGCSGAAGKRPEITPTRRRR